MTANSDALPLRRASESTVAGAASCPAARGDSPVCDGTEEASQGERLSDDALDFVSAGNGISRPPTAPIPF